MIGLNSGDKIQGDTTTTSKVDYSIFGYKASVVTQMANGQLPNFIGDLYTAASADAVLSIILVNTNTTTENVNLYILPLAGTARRLIAKDLQLLAGYSLHTDGKTVEVLNTVGQVIYVGTPGATGNQGIPGLFVPGMDADPPEEPMMIPGTKGDIGLSASIIYIPSEQGDQGDDGFPIPIKGDTGAAGSVTPVIDAGGAADVITLAYNPAITALTDMLRLDFVAAAANATTTPTAQANATTAHTITKQGNVALAVGDIKGAGMVCQIQYNLAGTRYELLNPAVSGAQSIDLTAWTGDDTLTATECAGNVVATNTDAGAAVNLTLPAGAADLALRVIVTVAQYLRITAAGSDKFRYWTTEGAAGGYVRSNTIGTSFLLVWSGGNWCIMDLVGILKYDE